MKVLITGGAGFIGSHLADFLIQKGQEVSVIDNLITGFYRNIQHLEGNKAFHFVKGDVQDADLLNPLIQNADYVVHFAAPVGVKFIMNNPVHTILDCVHTTEAILKAVQIHKIPILVASTSEVYGKHLDILDAGGTKRLSEEDYRIEGSSRNHRWAYANVKSLNEFLTFAFIKQYGIQAVITRFFNTAGARQRSEYGMVIPNFVQAALKGDNLRVYGNGLQRRSFIHIQDTIEAVWALMQQKDVFGEVFNIGNPDELNILELAKMIIEKTGSSSIIQQVSYEDAYGPGFEEMDRRTADISKLSQFTQFKIQHKLSDILDDVIAYEKRQLTGIQ